MNQGFIFLSCYILSSFFCYLIDIYRPDFRLKMELPSIVNREYKNMIPLCSVNALTGTAVLALIDNHIETYGDYNNNYFITNFILWLIITDFWFYFLHRLFHQKLLYKYHAVHHNYNYTFGIGAIYAHPIDFLVTNIFPVSFPIFWLSIPYKHTTIITIFSTCYTTIISHGGFKVNASKGHLIHHVKRKHNYGLIIFDRLLNTHSTDL